LKGNFLRVAEWALAHGASANPQRATDERTPAGTLYEQAVRGGLNEFAELLARYGAVRTATESQDARAFASSCFRLDRDRAATLAREHPQYLQDPAPLLAAAERNRADVVALLLDLGMSPNLADESGLRAMHSAAYHGADAVVTLLIERGAEVDPYHDVYDTPIGAAQWGQRFAMVDRLTPLSTDVWTLVPGGKVERLRGVLTADPRRARATYEGETPLFYLPDDEKAAAEIVRLFLAHGADPHARRRDGTTAGQIARARGLFEAADLLG
jgi:ankyrin repeat protein